jgi:hypothetical protein
MFISCRHFLLDVLEGEVISVLIAIVVGGGLLLREWLAQNMDLAAVDAEIRDNRGQRIPGNDDDMMQGEDLQRQPHNDNGEHLSEDDEGDEFSSESTSSSANSSTTLSSDPMGDGKVYSNSELHSGSSSGQNLSHRKSFASNDRDEDKGEEAYLLPSEELNPSELVQSPKSQAVGSSLLTESVKTTLVTAESDKENNASVVEGSSTMKRNTDNLQSTDNLLQYRRPSDIPIDFSRPRSASVASVWSNLSQDDNDVSNLKNTYSSAELDIIDGLRTFTPMEELQHITKQDPNEADNNDHESGSSTDDESSEEENHPAHIGQRPRPQLNEEEEEDDGPGLFAQIGEWFINNINEPDQENEDGEDGDDNEGGRGAEEINAIMEVVGMEGPLRGLLNNAIMVELFLTVGFFGFIFFPYCMGRMFLVVPFYRMFTLNIS